MANNEINDLTAKTTPVSTDEVEIQETAGGLSKKATVGNLAKGMSYNDLNDKPTIPTVSDTAYDATSWNGNTDAPTKNAIRDKIESMGSGSGDVTAASTFGTDNVLIRSDGTSKGVQSTGIAVNDSDDVSGVRGLNMSGELYIDNGGGDVINILDGVIATTGQFEVDSIAEKTNTAGVTIDGVLIKDGAVDGVDVSTTYRTGGTDVALADGGTGASLTDPNADRIMFWDDSAGAVTWLTASTGLTLSGTNLTARTSSTTQTGIVELATTAETTTATDTARAVTPAGIGAERTATATLTNKTLSTGSTIDANVTVTEVLKKVYPVGSIYAATVSTNPATLFGFGTWAAYAEGRVMVGKAAAGTFSTAGATGGAETHTLTTAEMPTHSHGHPSGGNWKFGTLNEITGVGGLNLGDSGSGNYVNGSLNGYADIARTPVTATTGGGGAHNNLQPYIVAYIWERTA